MFPSSTSVHHGKNPLLKLLGVSEAFPAQLDIPKRIDHGRQDLGSRELDAGGKEGVFAEFIEEIHLLAVE